MVLTNFGIARPLEAAGPTMTSGLAIGRPAYMAPEQVEARRDIDGRVDIYTFGILLFVVLSRTLPFHGETSLAIAAARLIQPPPDVRTRKPDVPAPLAEVVLKCMARDRDARFANFQEVTQALAKLTMPIPSSIGFAPSSLPSQETVKTVAVLPFRNAGASEDAFLADGLWDDLIDSLSMTAGLRVRPRSSMSHVL